LPSYSRVAGFVPQGCRPAAQDVRFGARCASTRQNACGTRGCAARTKRRPLQLAELRRSRAWYKPCEFASPAVTGQTCVSIGPGGPMSSRLGRGAVLSCIVFGTAVLIDAAPASGQYFGRQKVQYEEFD